MTRDEFEAIWKDQCLNEYNWDAFRRDLGMLLRGERKKLRKDAEIRDTLREEQDAEN